jgi:TetR/AcrR family transcriptional regulator, tetracycline repressor protein
VREPLTKEKIIETAQALLETDGPDGLSMRLLAAKLGVATTAIYWHVGSKDQLLDALVDRLEPLSAVRTTGRTPEQRIISTAHSFLRVLETHRALVTLANERGRLDVVFNPARRAVAEELGRAGLRGARLARYTHAVVQLVSGHAITRNMMVRLSVDDQPRLPIWPEGETPAVDKAGVRRLHETLDLAGAFELTLTALVRACLAEVKQG